MVFIIFTLAAVLTVLAAIELSKSADLLSEKTALGGFLIGTLLLSGATSLPEVTTSFSAVLIGNPDIAVGNILGSNMFNIFIIASFDLYYRKRRLFQLASPNNYYTAGLGLTLSAMTLVALTQKSEYHVMWIGLNSVMIVIIYSIGMYVIHLATKRPPEGLANNLKNNEKQPHRLNASVFVTMLKFLLAAVTILVAGTILSIFGDIIAEVTGLGSTFIGSFLMAVTTSLPETVAIMMAFKLKNINLAVGTILGSNIFNLLILVGSDILYQKNSILADVADSHLITAMSVTGLSLLLFISLMRKKTTSTLSYIIPSLLIIVGYFLTTFYLYNQ